MPKKDPKKWVVVKFLTEESQPRNEAYKDSVFEEKGQTFCHWPKSRLVVSEILKTPEKEKANDEKWECLLVEVLYNEEYAK